MSGTNQPPTQAKEAQIEKKQTQEKHIFRFKASENENVKVDLHQRWSERLTDFIGNTNAQQTKKAYRKNVKRHWRTFPIEKRENEKNSPGIQKKIRRKKVNVC